MMNGIVIDYQPFAKESLAFVFKDGQYTARSLISSNIEDMAVLAVNLCYEHSIYTINIDAPVEILNNFEAKITEEEQKKYSLNQIEVRSL